MYMYYILRYISDERRALTGWNTHDMLPSMCTGIIIVSIMHEIGRQSQQLSSPGHHYNAYTVPIVAEFV